ncbi:MAG: DUF721 domain-containing protein [Acidobacteria bacterium]|nr:DUF721 domain-containing protein [Acidobacteriota bacterium]
MRSRKTRLLGEIVTSIEGKGRWREMVLRGRLPVVLGEAAARHVRAVHVQSQLVQIEMDDGYWVKALSERRAEIANHLQKLLPFMSRLEFTGPPLRRRGST